MRNRDKWRPSKYIYRKGVLIASRDRNEVWVASRLVTDLVAECYSTHIPQLARGNLLDLGCGKAPLFDAYKDYVANTTCVDWEHTLHLNEFIDCNCDLTKALPFRDGTFDTIILSDVLEHIPRPEDLLREIARVLSIQGVVILNVPFYYSIHEDPHDYHRYTEFSLRRMSEGVGLKVIHLKSIGGTPEILADILSKNIASVPKIGIALAGAVQWLASKFIKTKIGKRISEKTRDKFPFGYFLVAEKSDVW